jgi:predicted RNA binding protein YcfA (HicA-like mRNA interferase family)
MKHKDLIRQLREMGCTLHRQGRRHEIWINPATGACQPVPRHKEINEYTASEIIEVLSPPEHNASDDEDRT